MPCLSLCRCKSRWSPEWTWPAVALVAWLALNLLNEVFVMAGFPSATACVFRHITGLPCPTCGMTRGMRAIAAGGLLEGIAFNPLAMIAMTITTMWLTLRLLLGRRIEISFSSFQKRIVWGLIALLVAANWAYVIMLESN